MKLNHCDSMIVCLLGEEGEDGEGEGVLKDDSSCFLSLSSVEVSAKENNSYSN